MFKQYSEVFGVAEVDSTFYRVPGREMFRALARLSPPASASQPSSPAR